MSKPEAKTRADMGYLIHDICNVFNRLKGMTAGYTTARSGKLLFSKDGEVYKLTIEKVGEGEEVTFDDLEKHLD